MGLDDSILRGIYINGFETPSQIQSLAVKPIVDGRDVIAQAQAGTGKTLAFTLGVLQRIDCKARNVQGVILAPTRELADQIHEVVEQIGTVKGVRAHKCYGGTNIRNDRMVLKSGVHVIIGTPGRINGLIMEKSLNMDRVKIFVLDEAHELLKDGERGFQEQVVGIFKTLPENVQCAIFSATLPDETLDITRMFMVDPVRILVKPQDVSTKHIKQFYVALEQESWKLDTLCDLYETISIAQSIIFCNSRIGKLLLIYI
jgi:translation initiation factor 4A